MPKKKEQLKKIQKKLDKDKKGKDEQINLNQLLSQVRSHYDQASSELTIRVNHKSQGFDEYDKLFRSTIDSKKWSFNSKIFIPMVFTSIFGKGTRLVTGKVKGRLVATKYGSELGAQIGTELLSSQYEDHDDYFDESLVSKWLKMDQNARKYGASFGLVTWKSLMDEGEHLFDGPSFEVLDNRKVYTQPGVSSISDSDYVIVERELSLKQLKDANAAAIKKTGDPAYINLDRLEAVETTQNQPEHESINTTIRGLTGYSEGMGDFRRFRILTEYRKDMWITWCPDIGSDDEAPGVVLRVTPNPYKHNLIPIIRLVYIPIDDDIYGVSEIEPGRSLQKSMNALTSGFIEAVSTELYPIIKGHPTNVDWKTIQFKPRAAWLMNNPQTDVQRLQGNFSFTNVFVQSFRLLSTMFSESMGDTAATGSQLTSFSGDKTATEIKDLALQRGARDNLNKLFISSAIEKMFKLWWSMDQQFLTSKKVIRIAGRSALEYFIEEGLNGWELTDEGYKLIESFMDENPGVTFEEAYEALRNQGILDEYSQPLYPVNLDGETLPKLQLESNGKVGFLAVDKKDLKGRYKFSVDLNTLGMPSEQQELQNAQVFMGLTQQVEQQLAQDGTRVKYKELLETVGEKLQIRNVDQYFDNTQSQQLPQEQLPINGQQLPQVEGAENPVISPQQLLAGAVGGPQGLQGGFNAQSTVN